MYQYLIAHEEIGIIGPKILLSDGSIQKSPRKNYTFLNYILGKKPFKYFDYKQRLKEVYFENYEYDKERNAYIKILNTIKGIKFLKLPDSLEEIGLSTFEDNKIEDLDISNCKNLKIVNDSSFYKNKIKNLKLPDSIEKIGICSFTYNNIENLDLSNCNNLRNIALNAFLHNQLQEIKILENIKIVYDNNQLDDQWNKFVDFYNNNGKKAGDYKLINNQWQYFKFQ